VNNDGHHTLTPRDIDAAAAALWRVWWALLFITALVALFI